MKNISYEYTLKNEMLLCNGGKEKRFFLAKNIRRMLKNIPYDKK
jgi:hypothetical protein